MVSKVHNTAKSRSSESSKNEKLAQRRIDLVLTRGIQERKLDLGVDCDQ